MPSYVVLARKWRPGQFSDIVGQNHIVRTLNNAIRSQRIHQAYLFTGSRGIGKTSIARIFAKVIRCEHTQEENELLKSCDQCSSCREITQSTSVDVIEIDGASHNGVDAVREIRESAKYMPSTGTRKIYIIDEVHMLTTAAFNALLKTLEEPPPHIVFIFATTEPHKIPPTILSRCQRFDYKRVTVAQAQTRLTEVTQSEKIETELGALALIARAAEGSMRDALSLLDQVIAFSGSRITVQSVRESIGLIEGQALISILSGIFNRKPLESLQIVERAYQQGHDLRVLTRSLIEFLHATLLAKVGATQAGSLELSEEEWLEIKTLSQVRTIEEMELIFQVLHQGLEWIARSHQPKVVLDVLLIKCATADTLFVLDQTPHVSPPTPNLVPNSVTNSIAIPVAAPTAPEAPVARKTEKNWEGFIEHIRKSRPLLASILEHSTLIQFPQMEGAASDKGLILSFPPKEAYFREQLQSRVYQEQFLQLSKDYFGTAVRLQIEMKESGESLASRKEREQKEKMEQAVEKAQNHPILREARSLFGGELGPIQIREQNHADVSS